MNRVDSGTAEAATRYHVALPPTVSIVVPVKDASSLPALVSSIDSQDYTGTVELIIVGNVDDNGWPAFHRVPQRPSMRILETRRRRAPSAPLAAHGSANNRRGSRGGGRPVDRDAATTHRPLYRRQSVRKQNAADPPAVRGQRPELRSAQVSGHRELRLPARRPLGRRRAGSTICVLL